MSRLVVEVDEGRHAAAAPMLFDELLDRWLEVKRASVAPRTIESYEWVARKYLRPRLGSRKLASLRTMDIDAVYAELGASGLSARTVRICHTVVHQALDQARRWGLVAHNAAVEATPPRHVRREVIPPTLEQVLLLLDAAYDEDPDFGAYLWVKSATGCRRGEVCALRWSDVDLDRPELFVRRAITQVGRVLHEGDTKTHQSRRVALDEVTVSLLRQHRLHQRERALALGTPLADDALLFATPEGRPWRPDVCTNRFGRLRATLGLDSVQLHDLRHFVASVLIDGGIPISTVSTRIGHGQMSTTLNLYTHAIPATDQEAAAYMGTLLAGSGVARKLG
ncbi:MAG: site-specific integrase [Microthrixaceae bacterium]|nr:site-specific integrase [Microthrixaceae bacterium]